MRFQRVSHGVALHRFDADDLDLRAQGLEIGADPGDQPAAADRDEHRVELPGALAQQFVAHRPLPGDHQFVVERVDEGHAGLHDQPVAVLGRFRVAVAMQHHLGAESPAPPRP